jgi:cytochrome c oxidase subunit 4
MQQAVENNHTMPYGTLVRVWLTLLLLTAILVFASTIYHRAFSVWAMLTLTPLKAGLVFFYFMHLKFERPLLKSLVLVTISVLIVFIGLTFLDIFSR